MNTSNTEAGASGASLWALVAEVSIGTAEEFRVYHNASGLVPRKSCFGSELIGQRVDESRQGDGHRGMHDLPVQEIADGDVVRGARLTIEAGGKRELAQRSAQAERPGQQIDFVEQDI